MAQAIDTARAILDALTRARSAGTAPTVIVLDDATRESLQRTGLGYWSAGSATWSLFNVPVVTGLVSGWQVQLSSESDAPEERAFRDNGPMASQNPRLA